MNPIGYLYYAIISILVMLYKRLYLNSKKNGYNWFDKRWKIKFIRYYKCLIEIKLYILLYISTKTLTKILQHGINTGLKNNTVYTTIYVFITGINSA